MTAAPDAEKAALQHLKTLEVLFIVLGALGLFGTAFSVILFPAMKAMLASGPVPFPPGFQPLMQFFLRIYPVSLALGTLNSALSLVAGWGLMKYHSWARIVAIVAACLHLTGFPLGTAFGVYAIWVLMKPEAIGILERGGPLPPVHPPPFALLPPQPPSAAPVSRDSAGPPAEAPSNGPAESPLS